MPPITIDAEELIMALENHDYDMQHYPDRETGGILVVTLDFDEDMDTIEGEQWFRFYDAELTKLAQAWLAENDVDATLQVRTEP